MPQLKLTPKVVLLLGLVSGPQFIGLSWRGHYSTRPEYEIKHVSPASPRRGAINPQRSSDGLNERPSELVPRLRQMRIPFFSLLIKLCQHCCNVLWSSRVWITMLLLPSVLFRSNSILLRLFHFLHTMAFHPLRSII